MVARLLLFAAALSGAGLRAQTPVVQPGGVQNAASLSSQDPLVIAPQMIVTLRGQYLAASAAAATKSRCPLSWQAPRLFNGVAAPLFSVSPAQINVQVPSALSNATTASIVVTTAAGTSATASAPVAGAAYGIFTQDMSGCGQGEVWNVHPNGSTSLNSPQNSFDPSNDVALTLYMTGFGGVTDRQDGVPWVYNPSDNAAYLAFGAYLGVPGLQRTSYLKALYAGPAPGLVGVDQINLQSPGPNPYPQGCALPLYLTDYSRSASQFVNVSIHMGGGAC